MPNNDPAIEIPLQSEPNIPDNALEKVDPPFLGTDLEPPWQKELERKRRETEQQAKEDELNLQRIMLVERKRYASWLFRLSAFWLGFIGIFLVLASLKTLAVNDSVLIALITTTTANVLGLFYIVARWLFPNKANQGKDDQLKES